MGFGLNMTSFKGMHSHQAQKKKSHFEEITPYSKKLGGMAKTKTIKSTKYTRAEKGAEHLSHRKSCTATLEVAYVVTLETTM